MPKNITCRISVSLLIILTISVCSDGKLMDKVENKTNTGNPTPKHLNKLQTSGSALLFADELKQTLERYLFGICPHSYKMPITTKGRNTTTLTCDVDLDQQDLAGRLASLSLRAHSAGRGDCGQLGAALAGVLGELARTSANRQVLFATNDANKKRKLSKSQKAKIQAKQRTALAVKKKAAATAAAAAAKMATL